MPAKTLRSADNIELVDTEFKNENWEEAAKDLLRFWDDGVRTFVEMDERGKWSRTMYSNVFEEHFKAISDDLSAEPPHNTDLDLDKYDIDSETFVQIYRDIYPEAHKEGFREGVEWARQNL